MQPQMNRRHFLKQSLSAVGTASLLMSRTSEAARVSSSALPSHAIRLGGPLFAGTEDPEEMARIHRQLGYRAAYCPKVDLKDSDKIRAISNVFRKQDVVIAEVGRWVNLLDSDAEKRRTNLKLVTDGLALAEEIGALCCVDIAGSFNTQFWYGPHPDNLSQRFFDAAVENARNIIDSVKPKRAKFCYEMMGWSLPDSPDNFLKLLKAIDRDAFAVHLDPCNLVNEPVRFYHNTNLLNECFDKLGQWIVSCHAKDLTWDVEMNIHFREVRPGAGSVDYATYLRRLAALPHEAPLMLEHLPNAEEYDKARLYLFDLGRQVGINFGRDSV